MAAGSTGSQPCLTPGLASYRRSRSAPQYRRPTHRDAPLDTSQLRRGGGAEQLSDDEAERIGRTVAGEGVGGAAGQGHGGVGERGRRGESVGGHRAQWLFMQ